MVSSEPHFGLSLVWFRKLWFALDSVGLWFAVFLVEVTVSQGRNHSLTVTPEPDSVSEKQETGCALPPSLPSAAGAAGARRPM